MGHGLLWPVAALGVDRAQLPEDTGAAQGGPAGGLGPVWDIVTPGFKGWVLGPFVRIGWLPEWYNLGQRSHLAFRGMVKATPTGCRMTGWVRMNSLLTPGLVFAHMELVYCLLATQMHYNARYYGWRFFISFVCISLIIWLSRIGAKAAAREIHHHLAQVCLSAREQAPKEPGPLTPV